MTTEFYQGMATGFVSTIASMAGIVLIKKFLYIDRARIEDTTQMEKTCLVCKKEFTKPKMQYNCHACQLLIGDTHSIKEWFNSRSRRSV